METNDNFRALAENANDGILIATGKPSQKSPKSQSRFPQPQLFWLLSKGAGKALTLPH